MCLYRTVNDVRDSVEFGVTLKCMLWAVQLQVIENCADHTFSRHVTHVTQRRPGLLEHFVTQETQNDGNCVGFVDSRELLKKIPICRHAPLCALLIHI